MYEKTDEAEVLEPLNSDESSMPQAFFPPTSKDINPALPEETVVASPEALALQDTANSPQEPPL